jgi:hypothetical protein
MLKVIPTAHAENSAALLGVVLPEAIPSFAKPLIVSMSGPFVTEVIYTWSEANRSYRAEVRGNLLNRFWVD